MTDTTKDYINNGIMFQNKAKLSDRHPDYTGNFIMDDGFKHSLSGWVRTDKNGDAYLTVSIGNIIRDKDGDKVSAVAPVKTITPEQYAIDTAKRAQQAQDALHS